MPSYTVYNIKMQRESNSVPWGFRMQGGRECGSPLQIQKVNPSSLAERYGVQAQDYIVRIGQQSTEHLQHQDAQELIKRHNNVLELVVQRGAPPTSTDFSSRSNFPSNPSMPTGPSHFAPQHPAPQVGLPISNDRMLMNQSFNTPIGLYSAENVSDTIARTLQSMSIPSNYQAQQPNNFDALKPQAPKPMSSPAPYDYTQQRHPTPFGASSSPAHHQPNLVNKPTFNPSMPSAGARPGPRPTQKGSKGSALLNRNDALNQVATCNACQIKIRGPFISAIGHCYCVNHFTCSNCSIDLVDCGFVEENGKLYCEKDFEQFAPHCAKCSEKILKENINALDKNWHPECFTCAACKKSIGHGSFHIEAGQPYCVEDYRRMFQAKCTGCEFPIEAGDKYLEAMGGIYHAECFNCSTCQVSLDGQGFVVKDNRPYCRQHARQKSSIFN